MAPRSLISQRRRASSLPWQHCARILASSVWALTQPSAVRGADESPKGLGVTKSFGRTTALDSVDLGAGPGVTGLLGPTAPIVTTVAFFGPLFVLSANLVASSANRGSL
jgi:hypothetical protein